MNYPFQTAVNKQLCPAGVRTRRLRLCSLREELIMLDRLPASEASPQHRADPNAELRPATASELRWPDEAAANDGADAAGS